MEFDGILQTSSPLIRTPECHVGFTNLFSHGFDHPNENACYLVEQRHLFLRNAPGCGIWHLPPPPVHCAWGSPRRNYCALSAGNVWVPICPWCKIFASNSIKRITVGYHRLYSHRAFNASISVRAVLALIGASGFQGSIKVGAHLRLVYAMCIQLCFTAVVVCKHS